jgi:TPR repeat protein
LWQAVEWYRKAAEQGHAKAQSSLGVRYYIGEGVPQDYAQAVKWFRKAAEQGDAATQSKLGVMYYKGEGVIQDNVYAHMWANIAASLGYERGPKVRDIIAEDMTAEQIAEAQKLARECVKKNYKGC